MMVINLNIKNNSYSSITETGCDIYTSPSGKYTWASAGVYADTIQNRQGCDSIMTISLNILNSSSSSRSIHECGRVNSPSGKYTWTQSGVFADTLLNSLGCDSVITFNLTIDKLLIGISPLNNYLEAIEPTGNYQWYDCENGFLKLSGESGRKFLPSRNGHYAVSVTKGVCADTSECMGFTWLTAADNNLNEMLLLYPNPFSENLFLRFPNSGISIISLYNSIGQKVYDNSETGREIELKLGYLPSGVYYLDISGMGERIKLIKM
jgi:hypothetical protein